MTVEALGVWFCLIYYPLWDEQVHNEYVEQSYRHADVNVSQKGIFEF